jgi:hypothetical protein
MNSFLIAHVRGNEALNNRNEGMIMILVEENGCRFRVAYHTREGFPSLLIHYILGEATEQRVYADAARRMLVSPQVTLGRRVLMTSKFLEYRQYWVGNPTSEPDYLQEILRQNHFQRTRVRNLDNNREFYVKGRLNQFGLWAVDPVGLNINGTPRPLTERERCFDVFIRLPLTGDHLSPSSLDS